MGRMKVVIVCAAIVASRVLWGMSADELVARAGVAGGLCSFPRATQAEEALALELAKKPTFVVHVMCADAAAAARIRDKAEAEGLLGRSLYVEQGGPAPLPFADRLVDLLVGGEGDVTPEVEKEWLRVLAPVRGVGLVGARTLKAKLPAGSDAWTHRCHAADNAQVSDDATLRAPFLSQWWGLPRQEGFWGTTVVAGNGRMFTILSSRHSGSAVFLTARSLTNGLVLWRKLLRQAPADQKVPHGGYIPGRSGAIVAGDTLLLIDRDGVARLSGETGAEQGRIAGPKPGGQVKWIGAVGGALAMLAGDADIIQPITYQTVAANPRGAELGAYEVESGRQLWRESAGGDVDERLIAARDDRLYYLAEGVGLVCRELKTGKAVWTTPDAALQAEFRSPESKKIGELLFSQPALMALDDVLVLRVRWAKNAMCVSRADGKVLWRKPMDGGRALTGLAWGGQWIAGGTPMDLKTGEQAKGPAHVGSGCGPTTATPGLLITCFGAVHDMATGKLIRHNDIKSPCDVGTLVAEGMMVTVPSECGCNYEIKGYRTLTSAGAFVPHTAPDWKGRLTVAEGAEPAVLKCDESDWPTYRRDAQRSAASAATVGDQPPKALWRWTPAGAKPYSESYAAPGPRLTPDFIATAPVAAGGRAWFTSADGTVRCLEAASGKEVWKFPTGGMPFAPPTVWEGRVLVGGGDGRVYCLDAATGRCLWRFLAAPAERRVFWLGHLVSTWPIIPGVLIQDGVAYTVAGYQEENGVHAYALDPKTGKVIWEKDDAGSGGAAGPSGGIGCFGNAAIGGGKLWLASGGTYPGSFDLASGAWLSIGGIEGSARGCEIAVLDGKWVVMGGRRLTETQDNLMRPLGGSGFSTYRADAAKRDESARVPLMDAACTTLPAWDAELAVMPPKGVSGGLTAVPTAKLFAWLAEAGEQKAKPPTAPKSKPGGDWSKDKAWATEGLTPVACALAKDALVVASAGPSKLTAFRRTDGSKAWAVDLPEQPAMNRLALDRDGRVLVTLCDGSVVCVGR
ncbi:MAG: hypothetical protein FJ291_29930 [Planctomycetes bacterium]|nr:hypothetical protein [Planctomycetota bacterium]